MPEYARFALLIATSGDVRADVPPRPRVRRLADEIIRAQRREIEEMKRLIEDLEEDREQ